MSLLACDLLLRSVAKSRLSLDPQRTSSLSHPVFIKKVDLVAPFLHRSTNNVLSQVLGQVP